MGGGGERGRLKKRVGGAGGGRSAFPSKAFQCSVMQTVPTMHTGPRKMHALLQPFPLRCALLSRHSSFAHGAAVRPVANRCVVSAFDLAGPAFRARAHCLRFSHMFTCCAA